MGKKIDYFLYGPVVTLTSNQAFKFWAKGDVIEAHFGPDNFCVVYRVTDHQVWIRRPYFWEYLWWAIKGCFMTLFDHLNPLKK